ncbi:NRDE family protein [Microbacterium sp. P02]|uniref:NRDE family protein n=1 Tax=Microbacterium sp. P02 TaxID=3366260 RepID=UPI00366E4927
MCTVIIHVPVSSDEPTRVLAIRDEDPGRAWDPLGRRWPEEYPDVVGVRDQRSGGAWLATDSSTGRFAVLLNRADVAELPAEGLRSRGEVVLDSVAGRSVAERPRMHGFNLVEVARTSPGTAAGASPDIGAAIVTWDGDVVRRTPLAPGTHMIAHDDIDDPETARIVEWLPAFEAQVPDAASAEWWRPWLEILARSSALDPTDERAIVRDNRPYGYPTLSLLVCAATIASTGVDVRYGELTEPGRWNALELG